MKAHLSLKPMQALRKLLQRHINVAALLIFVATAHTEAQTTKPTTTTPTARPRSNCRSGYSECCNGKCVRSSYIRDGDNDCGDGTDETTPAFQCGRGGCPTENACANHGTCVEGYGAYACICRDGWSGRNCDVCNGKSADDRPADKMPECTDVTAAQCGAFPALLWLCPHGCDSCVASTTTTTVSTTTMTKSSTTKTETTTTGLCNGLPDPRVCGKEVPFVDSACTLQSYAGHQIRVRCPSMCNACGYSTSTVSSTTTTTACGYGYGFSVNTETMREECNQCSGDTFQLQGVHREECKQCGSCATDFYDSKSCGTRNLSPRNKFKVTSGSGCLLSDGESCISSLNYPNDYGDKESCSFEAADRSTIIVVAFDTESGHDYLLVDGTRYSAKGIGLNGKTLDSGAISWQSDTSIASSGWKICLEQPGLNLVSNPFEPSACRKCDNIVCEGSVERTGFCSGSTNGYECKTTTTTTSATTTTTATQTTTTTSATSTTTSRTTTTVTSTTYTTTTTTTTATSTATSTVTQTVISTATSSATATVSSTESSTQSSTQFRTETSTQTSTDTSSATSTQSTTETSSVTTSASTTPTTSVSTTAETTATTTGITSITSTATSSITSSASTTASSTETTSQTATKISTASSTVSLTITTTATSTEASTFTSTAVSTVTTTAESTVTTSPTTTRWSTVTTTADSTVTSTQTTTGTSTVTTGFWNVINEFVESGELDALVKDAKSTNQRDRDELLEARSIYSGALQAKTSEDVFNYLGDNYIAVTCKAGYFVQFSLESRNGVCTPCFPGTFTSGNAGENFHKCAGQCPEGYTSSFGSRSEDSCFPLFTFMSMNPSGRHRRNDERRQSFGENSDNTTASASINAKDQGDNNNNNVQRLPSNLRSCEGAVDTTGNVWNNRGFAYITSKDECEEAARLLHRLDVFTMTVTKVEERCSDINYLTGETDFNTSFICSKIREDQGGTCASSQSSRFKNNNGVRPIAVDCSRTCNKCGTDRNHCSTASNGDQMPKGRPDIAPIGFCVLEQSNQGASAGQQRLSFYDECSAGLYDGSPYTPICKVVECPIDGLIKGSGAKPAVPGRRVLGTDNPECESNEVFKSLKETEESEQYKIVYYVIGGTGFACYLILFLTWMNRKRTKVAVSTLTDEVEDGKKFCVNIRSVFNWREFKAVAYLWFKLADITSDWGFWSISIRENVVLNAEMVRNDNDYELYQKFALAFTIFGSLLIPLDIYSLYLRYNYSLKKQAVQERAEKEGIPQTMAKQLKLGGAPKGTWLFPLITIIFEDIPQISLSIFYMQVMEASAFRDEDSSLFLNALSNSDPLAVFSLVLSSLGLIMNVKYGFRISDAFSRVADLFRRCTFNLFTGTFTDEVADCDHGMITEREAHRRLKDQNRVSNDTGKKSLLPCIVWLGNDRRQNTRVYYVSHYLAPDADQDHDQKKRSKKKKGSAGIPKYRKVQIVTDDNLVVTKFDREDVVADYKGMKVYDFVSKYLRQLELDRKRTVILVHPEKSAGQRLSLTLAQPKNSRVEVKVRKVSHAATAGSTEDYINRTISKMTVRTKKAATHASLKTLGRRFKEVVQTEMTYRQMAEQSPKTMWDSALQLYVNVEKDPTREEETLFNNEDAGMFEPATTLPHQSREAKAEWDYTMEGVLKGANESNAEKKKKKMAETHATTLTVPQQSEGTAAHEGSAASDAFPQGEPAIDAFFEGDAAIEAAEMASDAFFEGDAAIAAAEIASDSFFEGGAIEAADDFADESKGALDVKQLPYQAGDVQQAEVGGDVQKFFQPSVPGLDGMFSYAPPPGFTEEEVNDACIVIQRAFRNFRATRAFNYRFGAQVSFLDDRYKKGDQRVGKTAKSYFKSHFVMAVDEAARKRIEPVFVSDNGVQERGRERGKFEFGASREGKKKWSMLKAIPAELHIDLEKKYQWSDSKKVWELVPGTVSDGIYHDLDHDVRLSEEV